jgi:outer membrane translocation and assembly module TamA
VSAAWFEEEETEEANGKDKPFYFFLLLSQPPPFTLTSVRNTPPAEALAAMDSCMKHFQKVEQEKKEEPNKRQRQGTGMDSSSKAEGRLDEFVPEELLGKNVKKGKEKGVLSQAAAAEEEEESEVVDVKNVWLTKVTTEFRKRSKQLELAFTHAASTRYEQVAQQAKDDAPFVIAATFEAKPSVCLCFFTAL